ncbi:MAG: hypothetical protein HY922_07925 [Elusimicrobia bacterium]|nr:hypothetical protein [Elusimicrobiota bacterium]
MLALGLWHLWGARYYESFWDEDTNLVIGWLVSRGWLLHRDVFTHHMPVEYMPSALLAALFGNSFIAFRVFMLGLWGGVCALVFLLTRRWAAGALLAAFFAGLGSFWLTYWYGHMMLVESYWGYAVLLSLALMGGPLGETPPAARGRAVGVGALLAFAVSASLNCAPACLCLALWLACDRGWRRQWRWLAAGAAGWLALAGLWCLRHADVGLIYDQAVRFNTTVYARYCGYSGPAWLGVLKAAFADNVPYFLSVFDWGGPSQYLESLLKLAVWAWLTWRLRRREYWRVLWWLVFIPLLKVRGEPAALSVPFHSAGYFLVAALLLCRELSALWDRARGRLPLRWGLACAAALLLAPTWLASAALVRPEWLHPRGDPLCAAASDAVVRLTGPEDRIAVFPMAPRIYFETGRLPAVPSVYYLPWQADWFSQRAATLAALATNRPKVIVRQNEPVWGRPWDVYAADVEDWLVREYAPALIPGKSPDEPYAFVYLPKRR